VYSEVSKKRIRSCPCFKTFCYFCCKINLL